VSAQEGVREDADQGGDAQRGNPAGPAAMNGQGRQAGGGQPPSAGGPGMREWARRPRTRVIALATAIAAILAGAGVYLVTWGSGRPAFPFIGPGVTYPGPFRVMSVLPTPGSQQADGSQPIAVSFSAPVGSHTALPTVTPDVAGHWQADGDTMIFTPDLPFSPSTQVTVTVPGGGSGVQSAAGAGLATQETVQYTTASYSTTRLDEVLSQLGYLPLQWQESELGMRTTSSPAVATSLAGEETLAYDPPSGVFNVASGYPASLADQWQTGSDNVVLRGAVMAFQSEHNMSVTGDVTSGLWNALFHAAMTGQYNANGYTYAVADQVDPETLTIYHDGQVVLSSPANTGIPSAPTVNGTFPVYEKFLNTIMSGTNPDGSHYSDPVQFVSYFNGGDAVHYFARGSYGFQQSLGCVELPLGAAQKAYPYLTYGSLVTVTGLHSSRPGPGGARSGARRAFELPQSSVTSLSRSCLSLAENAT
jgi:hypothetical protein